MIKKLQKALKKDKDYYHSWKANIAMAIYDEYCREQVQVDYRKFNQQEMLTICNIGADNFLKTLIK